jgi:hypothetical protein
MAINVTLLPGMAGEVGTLVKTTIALLEDTAACVGSEGGDLIACLSAIVDLAELVYEVWLDFFPSRPKVGKDSASDDTALFLIPSANPVVALWGIGIRDLEAQGIPTSASGGAGYAAQLALANAALADLKKQFDTPAGRDLEVNGVQVNGNVMFGWYHYLGYELPNPDSNRTAINNRIILDSKYTLLVQQGFLDPTTGFPPKAPPPPPPKCPAGEVWDPILQMCVPQAPPPPPPGGGEQDELIICCVETQTALAALLAAVEALKLGGSSDDCCTAIVAAISAVVGQLARIAIALPALGTALNSIVFHVPQPFEVQFKPLIDAIEGMAPGKNPVLPRPPEVPHVAPYTLEDAAVDGDAAVQILFQRTVPFGQ